MLRVCACFHCWAEHIVRHRGLRQSNSRPSSVPCRRMTRFDSWGDEGANNGYDRRQDDPFTSLKPNSPAISMPSWPVQGSYEVMEERTIAQWLSSKRLREVRAGNSRKRRLAKRNSAIRRYPMPTSRSRIPSVTVASPILLMPVRHRHLRSQNGRTRLIALFADFPEVAPFAFRPPSRRSGTRPWHRSRPYTRTSPAQAMLS